MPLCNNLLRIITRILNIICYQWRRFEKRGSNMEFKRYQLLHKQLK